MEEQHRRPETNTAKVKGRRKKFITFFSFTLSICMIPPQEGGLRSWFYTMYVCIVVGRCMNEHTAAQKRVGRVLKRWVGMAIKRENFKKWGLFESL